MTTSVASLKIVLDDVEPTVQAGYQDFLEGLADPQYDRHDELIEWWGSDQFDPNHIDKPAIEQALRALAKKLTRKTRTKA
ncbi:hypothetical protein [Sinorhizobium sp. M4_45]|uniref:hypothetical protein n=1 Tax=Sinorhizobium sp. M4_45 TaxID=2037901 RepID=UPI000C9C6836|nr:hypothetical protein [Sinorhizobium sp. M4_45]PND27615.1 hypothetical protein CN933_05665 [Sinorhizobium sp. M4_45]